MATLDELVGRFGYRGTARIFQSEGYPVAEGRIREVYKLRKGYSVQHQAQKRAEFEAYAGTVNANAYPAAPSEKSVSSSRLGPPVKIIDRSYKSSGTHTHITVGQYDEHDRAGNITVLRNREVDRRGVTKAIVEAEALFGGGRPSVPVTVRLYGNFLTDLGAYRMASDGTGVRRDFYTFHTTTNQLHEAMEQVNRDIEAQLRDVKTFLSGPALRAEEQRIRNGVTGDPLTYPSVAARWASIVGQGVAWERVNYIDIWGY